VQTTTKYSKLNPNQQSLVHLEAMLMMCVLTKVKRSCISHSYGVSLVI